MDWFIANQERLAYAKVFIPIDASMKISSVFGVKLRGSKISVVLWQRN